MSLFDPHDMLRPEEREAIQVFLSERQSGGTSASEVIDRDWLIEDGNIQSYMLYYFPRDFWEWEPINDLFFDFLEGKVKGMAWLPGQHGKTTMLLRWFIYVMCREPQIAIGYTEKNEPTAMKRGLALLQQLQANKRLIDHYGRFKPTDSLYPWSMGNFTIRQRKELGDSATFQAFGAGGGSILGWRFNILVNDDPVTAENSASEAERANLLRWFNAAAKTCPTPLPLDKYMHYLLKHFLIGTVFRMDDLYHSVEKGGEFEKLHLKAVIDEATGATLSPRYVYENTEDLAEKALQSDYYRELKEAVDRQLKINLYAFKYGTDGGTLAFYQRYQNVAVDPEAQVWKDVHFKGGELPNGESYPGCFDEELSYGECEPEWIVTTGLDPQSGSRTKYSARVGLVTLAADPEEPDVWYLVDMDYGKWKQTSADESQKTQLSTFIGHLVAYGGVGYIETNAAQAGLLDGALVEAKRRRVLVSVRPHHTGKNKLDPYVGLNSLLPIFEQGRVRIPYATPADQRKSQEIANEFTMMEAYPYNDLVMAFWIAAYNLRKRLKARKKIERAREQPEYVNRLQDWHIPRHWSDEQKRSFLGEEDEDEVLEEA